MTKYAMMVYDAEFPFARDDDELDYIYEDIDECLKDASSTIEAAVAEGGYNYHPAPSSFRWLTRNQVGCFTFTTADRHFVFMVILIPRD